MPNWVYNTVKLEGSTDVIKQLITDKFDFFKINPPPQGSSDKWCGNHWTVSRNSDIDSFSVEDLDVKGDRTTATVRVDTAWSTPYALFAFLTKKHMGLRLSVHYQSDVCGSFEGYTEYEEGRVKDIFIDVCNNSLTAMREFKKVNPWFNYQFWEQLGFPEHKGTDTYICSERSSSYDELSSM